MRLQSVAGHSSVTVDTIREELREQQLHHQVPDTRVPGHVHPAFGTPGLLVLVGLEVGFGWG